MIPDVPEQGLEAAARALLWASLAGTALVVLATLWLHGRARRAAARRAARLERWTPMLLAVLDGDLAPEAFLAEIRPRHYGDLLEFLVGYAIRFRGGTRVRLRRVAAPLLPLARRHLASRWAERRALGVYALGLLSPRTPLVTLGTALRDPSRRVALTAARVLAQSRSPRAVHVMLTSLSRFGGAHTANVASLLAGFGLRAGAPITDALVHARTDARARVAALEALRQLSYVPAAGPARDLLARPGLDAETRAAALRLLADVGGAPEAAAVRPYAESDDVVLRIHAIRALGQLQCGPEDAVRLRRALRDPDVWVARQAAEALGQPAPRPRPPRAPAPGLEAPAPTVEAPS